MFGRAEEQTQTAAAAEPSQLPPVKPSRPSVLDQALAFGAPLVSLALVLYLVGSGALVFPFSSRVGDEPGLGVVVLVMAGLSLAMALLRRWRPNVGDAALGSAAFLVGFAVYYALIGALVDWAFSASLGRWERFALVFLLLAALGAIPSAYQGIWSRWKSRAARRSELGVRIEASAAPNLRTAATAPSPAAISFSLTRVRTAGWRLPVREPVRSWSTVVNLPTVVRGSYVEAAAAIDREALAAVAAVRSDLGDAEWTVPMLIDRADQLPWEGLVSYALTGTYSPDDSVFLYRTQAVSGTAPPPGQVETGIVSVLGWNPDAVEAWQKAGRKVETDDPRHSFVVHAVGTPVLGSAGPQFRFAGQHSASNAGAGLESAVSEAPSGFSSLSELPHAVSLLILQHEPAFSSTRLGSDREQAALLRVVACDLFQRGHGAVITIPSLEPELADVVLKEVARCLGERPDLIDRLVGPSATAQDDLLRLVHAVRNARRAVERWFAKNGNAVEGALDDRVEAAWDVCLYARRPHDQPVISSLGRTS